MNMLICIENNLLLTMDFEVFPNYSYIITSGFGTSYKRNIISIISPEDCPLNLESNAKSRRFNGEISN